MTRHLTTGGACDPFLPELLGAIRQANAIDLAVAFVRSSGLALLYPALADAIELRGARVRILTSDYLDVTEPTALRRLMLLAERGADLRLFESDTESFHLKAYLCMRLEDGRTLWGTAFVGSSNISRAALLDGLEWNLRVTASPEELTGAGGPFQQIRDAFEDLLGHPQVNVLDHDWIDAYEHRRQSVRRLPVAPIADEPETPPPAPRNTPAG
ncbi:MAG: helicase, partial [Sphingobacteriia bacterium]|nr:helicase [Sphingobacteriia bacterium]